MTRLYESMHDTFKAKRLNIVLPNFAALIKSHKNRIIQKLFNVFLVFRTQTLENLFVTYLLSRITNVLSFKNASEGQHRRSNRPFKHQST